MKFSTKRNIMKSTTNVMQSLVYRVWTPVYFFRRGMDFARREMMREASQRQGDLAVRGGDLMRERLGCETVQGQLSLAIAQADTLMEELAALRTMLWMTEERLRIAGKTRRWMEDLISKMLEGREGMELGRRYLVRAWGARLMEREEREVQEVARVQRDAEGRRLSAQEVRVRMEALRVEMSLVGGKGEVGTNKGAEAMEEMAERCGVDPAQWDGYLRGCVSK